jgi:serine/threonine protein kinase
MACKRAAMGAQGMEPLTGEDPTHIAGYQLRARLGAGGMGRVYLAYTRGGRPVALKIVRPDLGADADFRDRFRHEAEAARRVHGLFTAQVLDADPDATPPWLVTVYVAGPSLAAAVVRHGPLPPHSVLQLMAGVAEALEAIHAAGVVHRDLKPSNVILAADGPRVIDFGIAQAADASAITRQGVRVGTPQFMAPEQIQGRPPAPALDVFALGNLAAYAVLGRSPFGPADDALFARILHQPPDLGDCPAPLRELIERCLNKDPDARPSPTELVTACRAQQNPQTLPLTGPWLPAAMAADLAGYTAPPPPVPLPPPAAAQPATPTAPLTSTAYPTNAAPPAPSALVIPRTTLVRAATAVVAIGVLIGLGVAFLHGTGTNNSGLGAPPHSSSTVPAASGSQPPATGTGPASPSTASGPDACLIGTWTEVTRTATSTNTLGQQVVLTAHGPATYIFRSDGTGTATFNNDTLSGTVNGTAWTDVATGTATYDYQTSNGTLLLTNAQTSGTETLYANGLKYLTTPLASKPSYTYACSSSTLEATSTDGLWSFEATRSS